jgi:hypothetical protein
MLLSIELLAQVFAQRARQQTAELPPIQAERPPSASIISSA